MTARKTEPLPIEDIPLPPDDPDFDEDAKAKSEPASQASTSAAAAPTGSPAAFPAAALDFVDDVSVLVPIDGKFRQGGMVVSSFTCRPLTLGKVQELSRRAARDDGIELMEIYAAIAGTDAATLRGLREPDGDKVVEAARDFLPRAFRGPATE